MKRELTPVRMPLTQRATQQAIRVARLAGLLLAVIVFLAAPPAVVAKDFAAERKKMVEDIIIGGGIKDPRVVQSMRDTPRHEFMLMPSRSQAYFDMAIAIGEGQTISPPFIVAYMTEQLLPKPTDKVLEIGTGSGFQAAVLSPLVKDVYTIEIVKPLGERAARTLKRLKYANVHTKVGDGYQGWPEYAPFDKIIVTCSPDKVPPKLVEQLREGGRMIVPVGKRYEQTLYLFQKEGSELKRIALLPTLFVPMTGKAEDERAEKPDPLKPSINNGSFERLEAVTPGSETLKQRESDPLVAKAVTEAADKPADKDAEKNAKGPGDDKPKTNEVAIGWHYDSQMELIESNDAPDGTHYAHFSNDVPDRNAQALQGMAVDGRKVHTLDVSLWVKGQNIRAYENYLPSVEFVFYDDHRAQIGYAWVGRWRESFPWQHVTDTVEVPTKAREAIVRIGLNGATGEISMDALKVKAGQ